MEKKMMQREFVELILLSVTTPVLYLKENIEKFMSSSINEEEKQKWLAVSSQMEAIIKNHGYFTESISLHVHQWTPDKKCPCARF